jgi:hypothetical protein
MMMIVELTSLRWVSKYNKQQRDNVHVQLLCKTCWGNTGELNELTRDTKHHK